MSVKTRTVELDVEAAAAIIELDRQWAAFKAGEPPCRTKTSFAGLILGARRAFGLGMADET
jgi:hypothetical protein